MRNAKLTTLCFTGLTLLCSLSLIACGFAANMALNNNFTVTEKSAASVDEYARADNTEFYAEEASEISDGADIGTENIQSAAAEHITSRKMIKRYNLNAETLEFNSAIDKITAKTESVGGYVETSDITGETSNYSGNQYYGTGLKTASMTLRIPKEKTNEFLSTVGESVNITARSESTEDITLRYVDTESHVKALRAEQKQLLELMDKAETVEEIMTIQQGLTDVRYQLESYESMLKTYDNQVSYDTVNIYLREVKKETPAEKQSAFTRMAEGFADSTEGVIIGIREFIIWFVSNIPYFIVIAAIILAIRFMIKKIRKHHKSKTNSENYDKKKDRKKTVFHYNTKNPKDLNIKNMDKSLLGRKKYSWGNLSESRDEDDNEEQTQAERTDHNDDNRL